MIERRLGIGIAGAVGLLLAVQLAGLALIQPFEAAGYEAVDDPGNPAYIAMMFGAIIVATIVMLAAFRYDREAFIQYGIIAVGGLLTWYVVAALVPPTLSVSLGDVAVSPLPPIAAGLVVAALLTHPEWYVLDAVGIIIGAGATALFGISFSLLPIILLLVVLAVYDAISVYGTKHMLTLAEGAMSMRLPVLLVIPLSRGFSTDEMVAHTGEAEANPDDSEGPTDVGEHEMEAVFLGLGDVVIPSILVVSVAATGVGPVLGSVGGLEFTWPVAGAIVGSVLGLCGLLTLVLKGSAHAGLPMLNGGVLGGYLLTAVAVGVDPLVAIGL